MGGISFDHGIWFDLRTGVRGLRRAPAFTAMAMLTLALGIGANTAVFSAVYALLLRPLPYPAPDRLVEVWESTPVRERRPVAPANYLDWREQAADVFQDLASVRESAGNLLHDGRAERVTVATVSSNFFRTLGVDAVLGRTLKEDDPDTGVRAAVLGHAYWQRAYGGDRDVLGRTFRIDDATFEIVGVTPASLDYPSGAQLYVRAPWDVPPCCGLGEEIRQLRDARYFHVIGRMRAGISLGETRRALEHVAEELERRYPVADHDVGVHIETLHETISGPVRARLLLLLGAVLLVLLVACANVANLILLRVARRRDELSVRSALGAGRGRLARQLFLESAVLAVGGAVSGLALGAVVLRLIGWAAGDAVPPGTLGLSTPVLAFASVATLAAIVFSGTVPALLSSRPGFESSSGSRGSVSGGRKSRHARQALVAFQLALALVLVTGAGLLLRTLQALQNVDPGFEARGLATYRVSVPGTQGMSSDEVSLTYAQVLDAVREVEGVTGAALASDGPLDVSVSAGLRIEAQPRSEGSLPDNAWQIVSADYFRTAGIPLRRGRLFDERDRAGSLPVAVINETMARTHWRAGDAVGQRINTGLDGQGVWVTVVGVVGDTRNEGLTAPVAPLMYRPLSQPARFKPDEMMVFVRGKRSKAASALRDAVREVRADIPLFDARSASDLLEAMRAEPRFLFTLLGLFAGLALTLGAVGIYGVTAHAVRQRRRELGVRKAIGARPGSVVLLVLASNAPPVLAGLVSGSFAAVAGARLLRHWLFGVRPLDPLTMAVVPAVLTPVALLAMVIPAVRAVRVDPIEALRPD